MIQDILLSLVSGLGFYFINSYRNREAIYTLQTDDINGLVNNSDYIVYGHYENFIENWNMGDNHLSEVYSFVVDSSFLGDIDGTIEVAIPHTVLLKHTIEGEAYEAKLNLPNYHRPDLNKSYSLFLKKAQTKDVFGPSSVPFQAEVDSSGKVSLGCV